MSAIAALRTYLAQLPTGKTILWCYLIWYLAVVVQYFDGAPAIWLNALGISAVIGFALLLSVKGAGPLFGERWQTLRLFLMPFCVSSFSALIKGHGFILIAPPHAAQLAVAAGSCLAFVLLVVAVKRSTRVKVVR